MSSRKIHETRETEITKIDCLSEEERNQILEGMKETSLSNEELEQILEECSEEHEFHESNISEHDEIEEINERIQNTIIELEEYGKEVLSIDPELLTRRQLERYLERARDLLRDVDSLDPEEIDDLFELRDLYRFIVEMGNSSR